MGQKLPRNYIELCPFKLTAIENVEFQHRFDTYLASYAKSTRIRFRRVFYTFLKYCFSFFEQITDGETLSRLFTNYADDQHQKQNEKVSINYIQSELRALRRTIIDLSILGLLPQTYIPVLRSYNNKLFKTPENNQILGSINPQTWSKNRKKGSHTSLRTVSDDEFLTLFMKDQIEMTNTLVLVASNYLKASMNRYLQGKEIINSESNATFTDKNLLNFPESKNAKISLFSALLPNNSGFENLLNFINMKNDGFITRNFPGGNNHIYRFCGTTELEEYLGTSSVARAAACVIIIHETGINPESLYSLELGKKVLNSLSIDAPLELDLQYFKPRGRKTISKPLTSKSNQINAVTSINYIGEASRRFRKYLKADDYKRLFISTENNDKKKVVGASYLSFKYALNSLLTKAYYDNSLCPEAHKETLKNILDYGASFSKIRKSMGIIKWYQSKGDPRAAAIYLGNTEEVSIRNYLPEAIRQIFYRKHHCCPINFRT